LLPPLGGSRGVARGEELRLVELQLAHLCSSGGPRRSCEHTTHRGRASHVGKHGHVSLRLRQW
jgi:hypothetical protein